MTKAEAQAKASPRRRRCQEGQGQRSDRRAADAGEAGLRQGRRRRSRAKSKSPSGARFCSACRPWRSVSRRSPRRPPLGRWAPCGSCSRTFFASRPAGSASARPTSFRRARSKSDSRPNSACGSSTPSTTASSRSSPSRAVCTHLGCTPNWLEAEQKFKCPCHGSGFYKDGINFEGPAPAAAGALRDLDRQRRPDRSRQEPHVPGRNGAVERPGELYPGVNDAAAIDATSGCPAQTQSRHSVRLDQPDSSQIIQRT